MRLTHLADYAVVMMTAAARREHGARLSATELAEETGVPLPTAQKLMQKLAAHGLLVGHRGAGGGYALARPVEEVSLADIIEAVEGPIAMTMCSGHDGVSDCALDSRCRVKPHMNIVERAVRGALADVSLESLSHEPSPVRPEEPVSLSNRRLEGQPFETGLRLRSVPPQDERVSGSAR